jgi:hypothetical protein
MPNEGSPAASAFFVDKLPQAVNARIAEVDEWAIARRIKEADAYADMIASAADTLFAAKKPHRDDPQPGQVQDAIVGGLAVLAHRPGGVTFAGLHWCSAAHGGCSGVGRYALTEATLSRSARGAYFTPRDLAEEVTFRALEAVFYDPGPINTGDKTLWRIVPSEVGARRYWSDIACGSGAFLLAGIRYQADRICEAWNVEAGLPTAEPVSPAAVTQARRMAMHAMVGVDIDPLSVELSKISVALLTPTVPVDLTRRFACGDSLLGITSWANILAVGLDPLAPPVFDGHELQMLMLQVQLAALDGGGALCRVSDEGVRLPFLLADLAVGHCLASAGQSRKMQVDLHAEARHWARRAYNDPAVLDDAQAKAREWLDADLPAGVPSRQPVHWPLLWPEIFGYGAPGLKKIEKPEPAL